MNAPRQPVRLSGKQRRYLRSLGHHLDPTVMVGKSGLTPGLRGQLEAALADHELIKVRFGRSFGGDNRDALESLAADAGAALVSHVGRMALLYRRREEEPGIRLPSEERQQ